MSFKNIEKIFLFIIRWGSYLILLLPILVYRETLYPYIFSKIIFFRIFVEIIFAAYIFLAVYDKRYRPNWKNPLIYSSTIFVAILFVTSLFGVDFSRSFWSTQERMTGLLTILHFWAWFIVLASVFKNFQDWKKLIYATLISSFLVGLYGLGQAAGFKFLLKVATAQQMSSTLGNPLYLASYAMLHVFLSGLLFFKNKEDGKKININNILVFVCLIFNFIIVLLAASRVVTIVLFISLFLFLYYIILSLSSRKIKIFFIIVFWALAAFFIGGILFLQTQREAPWLKRAPTVVFRLARIDQDIQERTIPWQIAWQGLKERPVVGWGWENYNVLFNKYFPSQFFKYGNEMTWYDHSHNQLVDLLSLTGILGTAAYLLFYGSIFLLLIKKLRKIKNKNNYSFARDSIPLIVLALMFLAYFLQNLTVFDTPAPLIVFYFSLALVYFFATEGVNLENDNANQNKTKQANSINNSSNFPLPMFILLSVIFLFVFVYKFNFEPLQYSRLAAMAVSLSKTDLGMGLSLYQQALSKKSFINPEARLQLAKTVGEQQRGIKTNQFFKDSLDFAISEVKKNITEHPLDVRYWLYLGQLYNVGSYYGEGYINEAEKIFEHALTLSPMRQQIYFELGKTKIFQRKYEEGLNLMKQAVALDPTIIESRHNLGIAYLATNNIEEGLKELDQSYYGKDAPSLIYIAKILAASNDYQRAVSFSGRAVGYDPKNIEALGLCVIYYHKLGDKENEIRALDELRAVNPSDADQLEEFLKTSP